MSEDPKRIDEDALEAFCRAFVGPNTWQNLWGPESKALTRCSARKGLKAYFYAIKANLEV